MANNKFYVCFFFLAFFFSIQVSVFPFTTDLIHRDSPQSPFYDPEITKLERMTNMFHRSMSRAAHISDTRKSSSDMQSSIVSSGGTYLMKLFIGTPPYPVWGIADTGSDLTWFQCQPCVDCFPEDSPIFDPRKSSTYKRMSCKSDRCSSQSNFCNKTSNQCKYQLMYGDGSLSIGDMAAETLTFGSVSGGKISVPKVVFGCGYENAGLFEKNEDGIIGLAATNRSIIYQLSSYTNRKFSYCLLPSETNSNATSKIFFGKSVNMSGDGVSSTPMKSEQFYWLKLEHITVGNKSLPFKSNPQKPPSTKFGSGEDKFNIIIDSGTTLTIIPRPLYDDLAWEVRKANIEVKTYSFGNFGLCYRIKDNIRVPKIKFKFNGANELDLSENAAFLEVSEELMCLTIVASDNIAIFGNLAQQNLLVEFDIDNNKLSFQPTNCTKY